MITGPIVYSRPFTGSAAGGAVLPAGPAGESAYSLWLDAGNTGSVGAFLASLIGPGGPIGPTGKPGADGATTFGALSDTTAAFKALNTASPGDQLKALGAAPLASPTFSGTVASNGILQLGGPLYSEPTLSGYGYQLFKQRRLTGAAGGGVNADLNLVLSDDVDAAGGFVSHSRVQINGFGGSNAKGGRKGFQVTIQQSAPTAPLNPNRNYEALSGYMYVGTGDGGDSLVFGSETSPHGAKGGHFAVTGALFAGNAQNELHQATFYADYFNTAGGSAKFVNALGVFGLRAWQGNDVDAQIMSSGGDAPDGSLINVPWRHLYAVSDATSGSPVGSGTTLYGTAWLPWPVASISFASQAVVSIPADIATPRIGFASAHVGDYVTISGVTGVTAFNGTWQVMAVSSVNRTYTLNLNSSGFTGTPNFSNATVTIARAVVAQGIDLRGFQPQGFAFASPGFGVDGSGNVSALAVNLASSQITDSGTALRLGQNTGGPVLTIQGAAASNGSLNLQGRSGLPPYWVTAGDFVIRSNGGGTIDMNFPTTTTAPSAGSAGAIPGPPKTWFRLNNNGSGNPIWVPGW